MVIDGERYYQRDIEKIFENKEYATIEDLDICSKMPYEEYMEIAKEIAEELKIKGKDLQRYKKQVKAVCDRHGMDLKINEWVTKNTFGYDEKIQEVREIHDKVTNLVVEDVFYFQIEVPDGGKEIRYFVDVDKTLIRRIANFLESKNK